MELHSYLQLNDRMIDVDLTPNRSDCLSIAGLAQEVGALNSCEVKVVQISENGFLPLLALLVHCILLCMVR